MRVNFSVNGRKVSLDVEPLKPLVDVLREDLNLSGTKKANLPGEVGVELILLNGKLFDATLLPAFRVDGAEILTIEWVKQRKDFPDYERMVREVLKGNENLFCTSNIVMIVKNLFMESKNNDMVAVKEALQEIVCGELGFLDIVDGIKRLSSLKGKRPRS